MQDPNPLPWGAQDRFQAHFIVRRKTGNTVDFVAKTVLDTRGHFASRKVSSVRWNGGRLAEVLDADGELNRQISEWPVRDAQIYIEPTGTGVRIRSGWKNHIDFGITKEMFQTYDRIAGHIRTI